MSASQAHRSADRLLLAGATAALLVPFVAKPLHVDDPFWLRVAQQIAAHPLDPYGFSINWFGSEQPAAAVVYGPPAAAYLTAAVGVLSGWSEPVLHVAFLVVAVVAALGLYRLASEFTERPGLAAAVGALTPAFLVSATSLMVDVTMFAWLVWGVWAFVAGLRRERTRLLVASAAMLSLAVLSKYVALVVLPVLLVHSFATTRRPLAPLLVIAAVGLALGAHLLHMESLYGLTPLTEGGGVSPLARGDLLSPRRVVVSAAFAGGCVPAALLLLPLLWSRRAALAWLGLGLALGLALWLAPALAAMPRATVVQLAVLALGGLHLLALAGVALYSERSPTALVLALWLGVAFVFATWLNGSTSARSMLLLVPPAAILVARRLPAHFGWRTWAGPVVAAAALSTALNVADQSFARSAREAAQRIGEDYGLLPGTLWFTGHWGFQHYLEAAGGRPLDFARDRPRRGDWIAVPEHNTNLHSFEAFAPREIGSVSVRAGSWLAAHDARLGAGFYSSVFGPLPYAFGAVPEDVYKVYRVGEAVGR